jgi:hypothetical protein
MPNIKIPKIINKNIFRFKFKTPINLTRTPPPLIGGLINVMFSTKFNNIIKTVKLNKNKGNPIFLL